MASAVAMMMNVEQSEVTKVNDDDGARARLTSVCVCNANVGSIVSIESFVISSEEEPQGSVK